MLTLAILFISLLFAGVAQAQADLSCVITPKSHSRMIFGKRTAKDMRIWTCVIQNKGTEPLVVSRATALRVMIDAGVIGFSEDAVRIYWKENVRLGRPKTIGRVIQQVVRVGGIIIGSGIVDVGKTLRFVTVVGGESLPGIGAAISARAPTLENFERLAGSGDIGVAGNSDAEFVMFSGRWDGPNVVRGVIDDGFGMPISAPMFVPDAEMPLPPPSFAIPDGPMIIAPDFNEHTGISFDAETGLGFHDLTGGMEWDPVIPYDSPSVVRVSWMGRQYVGIPDSDLEPVLELARVLGIDSGVEMHLHYTDSDNDWASPDHLNRYGVL